MTQVKLAQQIRDVAMRNGTGYGSTTQSGNTSSINYDTAVSDWTAALKTNQQKVGANKWSRSQMVSRAKELYGDLADNIIENTEWKAFGL